jgi:glycosyltransferase involved in cell wall biosynthesis
MRLFRAIEALLAEGHEVHYLAVQRFPIEHPACHFHRFPWPANRTDNPLFWVVFHLLGPLLLLYLGIRCHITYAFAFGSTYGYALQPLRLVTRIPLTLFLRTDMMDHHRYRGRHTLTITIEHFIESVAIAGNVVYCTSQNLTNKITSRHTHFRPRYIATFPNDMPASHTVTHEAQKRELPLRLGCAGTLERNKNQAMAIDCVSHFNVSEAQLFVFGSGSEERWLQKLTSTLDASDRVRFMGWIDATGKLWSTIDVLLFPSYQEGSPNTVLEAIAHGIPVLASDIPEHREILPASSLLPVEDQASWVAAVRSLITHHPDGARSLAQQQAHTAHKFQFDWDGAIRDRILWRNGFTESGSSLPPK